MTPLQPRNHRLPALILLLACLLFDQLGLFEPLERFAYDRGVRAVTRPAETRVALITIDEATLERLGPWPLAPRHYQRAIEILNRAAPRVIAFTEPISPTDPKDEALLPGLGTLFRQAGNIVLPVSADWSNPEAYAVSIPESLRQVATLPDPALPWKAGHEPSRVQPYDWPHAAIGPQAARIGIHLPAPDPDRVARAMPLLLQSGDQLLPALPLAIVLVAHRIPANEIRLQPDGIFSLGDTLIATQNQWRIRPCFHPGSNQHPEFAHFSLLDLLDGKIPPERFRDGIVLIGPEAASVTPTLTTPVIRRMTPLELQAQAVTALLDGQSFFIPEWAQAVRLLLFGVVTLLMLIAPPLGIGAHLVTLSAAVALAVGLPVVHVWLLEAHDLWVPLMGPLALLAAATLLPLLFGWWFGTQREFTARSGKNDLHRALGLAYQGQQCWELAQEQLRLVPMDDQLMAMSLHLAHDLESAGRIADAARIYQRLLRFVPRDTRLIQRLEALQVRLAAAQDATDRMGQPPVDTLFARTVGRFQVLTELQHDPLGTLLLARDPASGKPVVLRIPSPPFHHDPSETKVARRRFDKENQTWMQRPNEGVVALVETHLEAQPPHLVMEHFPVNGNLERHLHPDDPLPLSLILYIATRAALALDHAHQLNLTHGALRPEDLIYDAKTRSVRIKEFGLARYLGLDAAGRGLSPYSAPEMVAGGAVDGRSDLYSLGAILFHLISGHPPFMTDDPEALREGILHAPLPNASAIRHDIPAELSSILSRLLDRNPQHRFARGKELAHALVAFIRAQVQK
ncbi:MAG: serine/threonine-protein kinase [Magnetococcus sp. YQC-9]